MSNQLTLEEVRSKTMKLLETNNPEDVAYITEEYLQEEAVEVDTDAESEQEQDKDGNLIRSWYGHSVSYGSRGGEPTYEFMSDSTWSRNGACAGRLRYWLRQRTHNHFSTGIRCGSHNNSALLEFRLR